jgi:hypothetical protein
VPRRSEDAVPRRSEDAEPEVTLGAEVRPEDGVKGPRT